MDNQLDVFETGQASSGVRDALLTTVDALALYAVIALNEAHGLLVNAGAVTGTPPSDQWYRLIEQLTECANAVDPKQQERRLCIGAAAFLSAESRRLEDHYTALPDNSGKAGFREHLNKIADQVTEAVDALLEHSELSVELAVQAPERTSVHVSITKSKSRSQRIGKWFLVVAVAGLVAIYGLVGKSINEFPDPVYVIIFIFVIAPGLVVLKWHMEARCHHRLTSFLRNPQKASGRFGDITRQSILFDVRAAALGDLLRRIRLVAGNAAAERRVCESYGFFTVASRFGSLERQLQDASESAENLAELVTDASEEARRFTASCRRDPREACAEYGRLPLVLDPDRIEAVIDNLVLVLRLTVEVAVDIPLHIQANECPISTGPAGEIAAEAENIFREFRGSSRPLKYECRGMLRSFDSLHRTVTAESITTLKLGRASRMTAQAAVAASVLAQPTARRPAVRTTFVRKMSVSRNRSWVLIGKATAAAFMRGKKQRVQ